jgi:uncharacterized protein
MVARDRSGLEILSVDECRRLLRHGGVGRLAWIDGARAVIRPVNFALDENRIVLRTGNGRLRDAAATATPATLETDGTRPADHSGWSVIISGTVAPATDDVARSLPLRPWAPFDKDQFLQVSIDEISGRRIGSGL